MKLKTKIIEKTNIKKRIKVIQNSHTKKIKKNIKIKKHKNIILESDVSIKTHKNLWKNIKCRTLQIYFGERKTGGYDEKRY